MTKITYKKKVSVWGLQFQRMIVHYPHGTELTVGRQAGRHHTGAVAESLNLIHRQEAERDTALEVPKPATLPHLLQKGHTFQSFPNSSSDWGLNIQIYKPVEGRRHSQSDCHSTSIVKCWISCSIITQGKMRLTYSCLCYLQINHWYSSESFFFFKK